MGKGTEEDVLLMARYLVLYEQYMQIQQRPGGYESDRKRELAAIREEMVDCFPGLREILTREKR